MRLPREPGKRESRYAHLFSGEPAVAAMTCNDESAARPQSAGRQGDRLELLESRLANLEAEVAQLRQQLAARSGSGEN